MNCDCGCTHFKFKADHELVSTKSCLNCGHELKMHFHADDPSLIRSKQAE